MNWTTAAPAVTTAFLSSLVEAVEALTIVLAVTFVRGWRPAGIGAIAGLAMAGAVVCFFEFTRAHEYSLINHKMVLGSLFLFGVGLDWLWSDFKQWND